MTCVCLFVGAPTKHERSFVDTVCVHGASRAAHSQAATQKLSPAHFVRLLNASLQTNLAAQQMVQLYCSATGAMTMKVSSIDGLVSRLEKASAHEVELTAVRHERNHEAMDALRQHGRLAHQLNHIKFVVQSLDPKKRSTATFDFCKGAALKASDATANHVPLCVIHEVTMQGATESFTHGVEVRHALDKEHGFANHYYGRSDIPAGQGEAKHADTTLACLQASMLHFANGATDMEVLNKFLVWISAVEALALPASVGPIAQALLRMTLVATDSPLPQGCTPQMIFDAPALVAASGFGKAFDSLRLGRALKAAACDYVDKASEDQLFMAVIGEMGERMAVVQLPLEGKRMADKTLLALKEINSLRKRIVNSTTKGFQTQHEDQLRRANALCAEGVNACAQEVDTDIFERLSDVAGALQAGIARLSHAKLEHPGDWEQAAEEEKGTSERECSKALSALRSPLTAHMAELVDASAMAAFEARNKSRANFLERVPDVSPVWFACHDCAFNVANEKQVGDFVVQCVASLEANEVETLEVMRQTFGSSLPAWKRLALSFREGLDNLLRKEARAIIHAEATTSAATKAINNNKWQQAVVKDVVLARLGDSAQSMDSFRARMRAWSHMPEFIDKGVRTDMMLTSPRLCSAACALARLQKGCKGNLEKMDLSPNFQMLDAAENKISELQSSASTWNDVAEQEKAQLLVNHMRESMQEVSAQLYEAILKPLRDCSASIDASVASFDFNSAVCAVLESTPTDDVPEQLLSLVRRPEARALVKVMLEYGNSYACAQRVCNRL